MDFYTTIREQERKGRTYLTRAVNVHAYAQDDQQPITSGQEGLVRQITLVDANTGHEITMDEDMLEFLAKTVKRNA